LGVARVSGDYPRYSGTWVDQARALHSGTREEQNSVGSVAIQVGATTELSSRRLLSLVLFLVLVRWFGPVSDRPLLVGSARMAARILTACRYKPSIAYFANLSLRTLQTWHCECCKLGIANVEGQLLGNGAVHGRGNLYPGMAHLPAAEGRVPRSHSRVPRRQHVSCGVRTVATLRKAFSARTPQDWHVTILFSEHQPNFYP
jgi:hypothetical protein